MQIVEKWPKSFNFKVTDMTLGLKVSEWFRSLSIPVS